MNPIVEHDSTFSPSPTTHPWTAAQSRAQFAALAKLRWHIFRNAFRRKGGGGELAARIILFPILGIVAFGPIIGAGYGAYKTNNDCGTIFGNRGFSDAVPGVAERGAVTQTALRPDAAEDITVYSAR